MRAWRRRPIRGSQRGPPRHAPDCLLQEIRVHSVTGRPAQSLVLSAYFGRGVARSRGTKTVCRCPSTAFGREDTRDRYLELGRDCIPDSEPVLLAIARKRSLNSAVGGLGRIACFDLDNRPGRRNRKRRPFRSQDYVEASRTIVADRRPATRIGLKLALRTFSWMSGGALVAGSHPMTDGMRR
jgi:hypothetical protein